MSGTRKGFLTLPPLTKKETVRQAALLRPILWAAFVVICISDVVAFFVNAQDVTPLLNLIFGILPVVWALWLLHRGRVREASFVFVLFMWVMVTFLVYSQGGLFSPVITAYLLVILVAGLLLGARMSYLFVLMSAAATALFLIGQEHIHSQPIGAINIWIAIISNLILLAVIVHLALKTLMTALHEAEQSQAQLTYQATLLQSVSEAIIATDLAFRITGWNKAAEKLYGWRETEALGQPLDQFLQEKLFDQTHEAAVQQLLETGRWQGELTHTHKDGQTIEIEGVVTLLCDEQGQPTGAVSINRDIRQQKQAERRYQNLFETMPIMVVLTRYDEKELAIIEGCNPFFVQQMGYELAQVLDRPLADFYSQESRQLLVSGGYYQAMEKGLISEERTLITQDGRAIETLLRAMPIYDANEQIRGTQAMFLDITARKEAERKVQEYAYSLEQKVAQRTEALQQQAELLLEQNAELDAFAHTVAHDLKNPLGQLMGYSELLEVDYDSFTLAEQRKMVAMIQRSARKMKTIIEELLLLASIRREEVQAEPVYMPDIVNETMYRLSSLIMESQAVIDVPPQWPLALGYVPWVEEVWMNYLSNALKYGGRPPHVVLGAAEQEDDMIAFWVRDHGPGLTEEQKAHMFKPFTRLERGRGTGHGLGLSIVHRIVTKLGGQVYVESEWGHGSTFGFTLPAVKNES